MAYIPNIAGIVARNEDNRQTDTDFKKYFLGISLHNAKGKVGIIAKPPPTHTTQRPHKCESYGNTYTQRKR